MSWDEARAQVRQAPEAAAAPPCCRLLGQGPRCGLCSLLGRCKGASDPSQAPNLCSGAPAEGIRLLLSFCCPTHSPGYRAHFPVLAGGISSLSLARRMMRRRDEAQGLLLEPWQGTDGGDTALCGPTAGTRLQMGAGDRPCLPCALGSAQSPVRMGGPVPWLSPSREGLEQSCASHGIISHWKRPLRSSCPSAKPADARLLEPAWLWECGCLCQRKRQCF